MELWTTAALGGAVFLGAATQRTSGLGFALVASPALVALLGPLNGVVVVNLFSVLTAAIVFPQVRHKVEYRKALLLLIPAMCAVVPGALVARTLPSAPLSLIIGILILAALGLAPLAQHWSAVQGNGGRIAAGALSGFMNVLSGTGGPAVTAYAVATRWRQDRFAATLQLYFVGLGTTSLLMRWSWPSLSAWQWVVAGVGVLAGLLLGTWLSRRIPHTVSRRFVVVLAVVGAVAVMVKGLLGIVGS